jgi:hypothetical protein
MKCGWNKCLWSKFCSLLTPELVQNSKVPKSPWSRIMYVQIWLNLPIGDSHFFLPLHMDYCHFGYKQKIPKN